MTHADSTPHLGKTMKPLFPLLAALLLGFNASVPHARATIPEPDHIVYGTVSRNGSTLGAQDTDVVIEALRNSDNVVVASYHLGDSPRSGDHYTLRIPLEAFGPLLDPIASLTGTSLTIVASDAGGRFAEVPLTTGVRGRFQELNIGQVAAADSDGDGLLDAWELACFGNLAQSAETDLDGDGLTDMQEYLAGTDPKNPTDFFSLRIAQAETGTQVSFKAIASSGAGYEGTVRQYTLEATADLGNPNWTLVQGAINVVGAGQIVQHVVPEEAPIAQFFRVVIQLKKP